MDGLSAESLRGILEFYLFIGGLVVSMKGLQDLLGVRANIGLKRLGDLDNKAFQEACRQKFSTEEAQIQASTLISLWQSYVTDSNWHPFKVIETNGNAEV